MESVFLSVNPFAQKTPFLFALHGYNGTLPINVPWCVDTSASATQCGSANIAGIVDEGFSLGAVFTPSSKLSWTGGGEHSLG